jgi:hypothetical protein
MANEQKQDLVVANFTPRVEALYAAIQKLPTEGEKQPICTASMALKEAFDTLRFYDEKRQMNPWYGLWECERRKCIELVTLATQLVECMSPLPEASSENAESMSSETQLPDASQNIQALTVQFKKTANALKVMSFATGVLSGLWDALVGFIDACLTQPAIMPMMAGVPPPTTQDESFNKPFSFFEAYRSQKTSVSETNSAAKAFGDAMNSYLAHPAKGS